MTPSHSGMCLAFWVPPGCLLGASRVSPGLLLKGTHRTTAGESGGGQSLSLSPSLSLSLSLSHMSLLGFVW